MNSINGSRIIKVALAHAAVCLLALIPATIVAQDARTVLTSVAKAMGAENLTTIDFSGTGSNAGIGQNRNPKVAWPVTKVKAYSRQLDYNAGRSHVQLVRAQDGGDQTENQYSAADSPWNSQYGFWLTPIGFIKGALANNASLSSTTIDGKRYAVVTFAAQNKYKVVGYINDQNMVERVLTWIDNDVLGDMPADAWYTEYKDFNGLKFPTMIVERQAGFPVNIVLVSAVKPNAPVNIPLPPPASNAAAPAVSVQADKVADGVYYLKGGTHHSVAVEFSDHIVLIEAPLNEQRSLAIIGAVKNLTPNKPIRYVVNTHHHFDHSGGLRTFVDAGATIITHETNAEFFAAALSAPRTQNPDNLARSQKKAVIETVGDKKILSDGVRTLELHLIRDNPHHDGILLAFLPKEKIVIEADVFTPPNPSSAAAGAGPVNRNAVSLVDNVERLKIDYETLLPLHGSITSARADLYTSIRRPVRDMKEILTAQAAPAAGQRGQRGQAAAAGAAAPTSAGQQILDTACTTCHNLNRVENKKLNEDDWRATVVRMKGRGADLTDSDTDALIQYLVKTYGPQ